MRNHYDVIVVGGGSAGYPAAIQSARLGATTLLVEKNGVLGGTTTAAGVALPGLFHAWGTQVIAGIGWDVVCAAVQAARKNLPDFSDWDRPHAQLQIPVIPGIYAALIDDAVTSAGVDLLLHTMLGEVHNAGESWTVKLCTKEALSVVDASVLIDCTADADVVAHAGFRRRTNKERQPGTLMFRFSGYDPDSLDYNAIGEAHKNAIDDGVLLPTDIPNIEGLLRRGGEAANFIGLNHVPNIEGGTSWGRTQAEISARQMLLRVFQFLVKQPGMEGLDMPRWAIECGIRETYTIDGIERITINDYESGRMWPDAISYSFYPIDVHRPDGLGVDWHRLDYGIVPTIPRGAMLPRGSDRLIAAGRCVSGDQQANSAYRVQASCMAMGQAAGALAALAANSGTRLDQISISYVHDVLRRHGAIVPGDLNIPPQSRSNW